LREIVLRNPPCSRRKHDPYDNSIGIATIERVIGTRERPSLVPMARSTAPKEMGAIGLRLPRANTRWKAVRTLVVPMRHSRRDRHFDVRSATVQACGKGSRHFAAINKSKAIIHFDVRVPIARTACPALSLTTSEYCAIGRIICRTSFFRIP
jgi:hypothetical protein